MNPQVAITYFTPLGFLVLTSIAILILKLPRHLAICPILLGVIIITRGQNLNIAGFNFSSMRILVFFGLIRLISKKEIGSIQWNSMDTLIVVWVLWSSFSYVILRGTGQAINNRLGYVYDTLGIYFLLRHLIYDKDTIYSSIRFLACGLIICAFFMGIEYTTGRNIFSIFGGVSEFVEIRNGRLRCQCVFAHPILAGTFSATCMPFAVGLIAQGGRDRILGFSALFASSLIVLFAGSSGAIISFIASIIALALWFSRQHLKVIRLSAIIGLLALNFIMTAPIWFIFAHIEGMLGGGTGYYRSTLYDGAVNHFKEWWLIGTAYTRQWVPFAGTPLGDPDNVDITSTYIYYSVSGGLLSLFLFLAIIWGAFKRMGKAINAIALYEPKQAFFLWGIGSAVFSHAISFLSVFYYDQTIIIWYFVLALSVCVGSMVLKEGNNQAICIVN